MPGLFGIVSSNGEAGRRTRLETHARRHGSRRPPRQRNHPESRRPVGAGPRTPRRAAAGAAAGREPARCTCSSTANCSIARRLPRTWPAPAPPRPRHGSGSRRRALRPTGPGSGAQLKGTLLRGRSSTRRPGAWCSSAIGWAPIRSTGSATLGRHGRVLRVRLRVASAASGAPRPTLDPATVNDLIKLTFPFGDKTLAVGRSRATAGIDVDLAMGHRGGARRDRSCLDAALSAERRRPGRIPGAAGTRVRRVDGPRGGGVAPLRPVVVGRPRYARDAGGPAIAGTSRSRRSPSAERAAPTK